MATGNPLIDGYQQASPAPAVNPLIAGYQQTQAPPAQAAPSTPDPFAGQSALGQFAGSANDRFFGGLIRGAAGLLKAVLPQSAGQKIDSVLKEGGLDKPLEAVTPAEQAGATTGSVEKGIATTVPTVLLPGESAAARVAGGAGLGYLQGLSQAGENGQNGLDAQASGLEGAGIGGATGGLAEGLMAGGKALAGGASDLIYNNVVGTPLRQALKGTDNAAMLQEGGITGSYDKILQKLSDLRDSTGSGIGSIVKDNAGKAVPVDGILSALQQRAQDIADTGGSTAEVDNVIAAIKKKAASTPGAENELPVDVAQSLKQQFGKQIGPKFEAANPETAATKKIAYAGLDNELDNALQGTGYTELNDKYKGIVNALDAVERRSLQQPSKFQQGINLLGAIGAAAHPGVGLPVLALTKAAESPTVGTPIAQALYKASQAGNPQAAALLARMAGAGLIAANGQAPQGQ